MIRKLNDYPEAQTELTNEIKEGTTKDYGGIRSIESAESAVERVFNQINFKKNLLAKYGPCPKCGSTDIDKSYSYGPENKLVCKKCGLIYEAESKDPWAIFELKQKAKEAGLEAKVVDEKGLVITPEKLRDIVTEESEEVKKKAKIETMFRSIHTVQDFTNVLIAAGVQSVSVDDKSVSIRLFEPTDLHFKAEQKTWAKDPEHVTRVTVEKAWSYESDSDEKTKKRVEDVLLFMSNIPEKLTIEEES